MRSLTPMQWNELDLNVEDEAQGNAGGEDGEAVSSSSSQQGQEGMEEPAAPPAPPLDPFTHMHNKLLEGQAQNFVISERCMVS